MKRLKVIIADGQSPLRDNLAIQISKDEQLELVGVTDNGKEAYEIYESQKTNVIIFDLLLPIYDGFTLLDKINKGSYNTDLKMIMTTPLSGDILLNEAFCKGVDYIIRKPYDAEIMAEKIKGIYFMNQNIENEKKETIEVNKKNVASQLHDYGEKIECVISNKLNEIGIPARLKGYRYMITAVKQVMANEEALEGITKILYPNVAKQHNSTPQRVEKAIRHAIEVAWASEDNCQFKKQFNYLIHTNKMRPTNTEFIAKLSQSIRIMA